MMLWDSGTTNHAWWTGMILLSGCANLQLALGPEGTPHFALEEVNGRVLVIRDISYFVASPDTTLEVGDRVVSMDNAEALLQFTQTDEQGEQIGEECQLRLPAEAQITLQSYRDCLDEDAIVLNNVGTSTPTNITDSETQPGASIRVVSEESQDREGLSSRGSQTQ